MARYFWLEIVHHKNGICEENVEEALRSKAGCLRCNSDHRRRLLILAGGAETRNEKQLHTNFSKLSVIKAQFGSLINDLLYPIH